MRYRTGPVACATGRLQAGIAANLDDFMEKAGNYVVPYTGVGTSTLKSTFIGPLKSGYQNGKQTVDVDVEMYTDGVFEYPLDAPAAAESPVGALVSATGPQTVSLSGVVVAEAIGKLNQRVKVGDLTAMVRITSIIPTGGITA